MKVATGWTLWAEGIVTEVGVIVGEDSGEILGDVRVVMDPEPPSLGSAVGRLPLGPLP